MIIYRLLLITSRYRLVPYYTCKGTFWRAEDETLSASCFFGRSGRLRKSFAARETAVHKCYRAFVAALYELFEFFVCLLYHKKLRLLL